MRICNIEKSACPRAWPRAYGMGMSSMSIEDLASEVAYIAVRDPAAFKRFNRLVIIKAMGEAESTSTKKKLAALLSKSLKN